MNQMMHLLKNIHNNLKDAIQSVAFSYAVVNGLYCGQCIGSWGFDYFNNGDVDYNIAQ